MVYSIKKTTELNIQVLNEFGSLLDEMEAKLRIFSHELLEGLLCVFVVAYRYPEKRTALNVHGGLLEVCGRHFSQSFEPAHLIPTQIGRAHV